MARAIICAQVGINTSSIATNLSAACLEAGDPIRHILGDVPHALRHRVAAQRTILWRRRRGEDALRHLRRLALEPGFLHALIKVADATAK